MAFEGQVALVTGGASGMGLAMALRLARGGAKVAVVDVDREKLDEAAARSTNISAFTCDVGDEDQVVDLVKEVERSLGPVDRLAHAAGVMPGGAIVDMSTSRILDVMRINYGGTVLLTKAVLPGMLARGSGDIIVWGSITGYAFSTRFGAYASSKAAVNAYMEILAHEHRGSGLRILLVAPPAVRTPLLSQVGAGGPKAVRRSLEQRGRAMSVEEVDAATERALERGTTVLLVGQAKLMYGLRRLSPALAWKLEHRANREQ